MLESLRVKNLALIEEEEIFFKNGLNVLTGETGAGKSVIIGSVNMALGEKVHKDMIRTGKEYALIEMVFTIDTKEQRELLDSLEIPYEDDTILIQRKISATRSSCRVCGETVSQKQLQDIADAFIDIHGQQDNLFLRNKKVHLEVLDNYLGSEISEKTDLLKSEYEIYRKLLAEYNENDVDENVRKREMDLLSFELAEIENAHLVSGEDEALEEAYKKMKNASKLMSAMSRTLAYIGSDNDDCALQLTERALRELNGIAGLDDEADALNNQLSQIDSMLSEFGRDVRSYISSLDFDEKDFAETQQRLDIINRLKEKYGNTIDKIFIYAEDIRKKLDRYSDFDAYREELLKNLKKQETKLNELCEEVSSIRKNGAKRLEKQLEDVLRELSFLSVQCELRFEKKDAYSKNGFDDVEFMISLNPGEPVRSLTNTASGGELSRIMLGLKTILAKKDPEKTFIFDEIDAGISGKTAWNVARMLGALSKTHQIILITHLPQIASMNDSHFEIKKVVEDGFTYTSIAKLGEEESIRELARLLGGDSITDAVLNNAREMRLQAQNEKGKS